MQVTVKDVAKAAEVSIGTVSRVLAGEPNVSAETTERVMKVIKKLNYTRLRRRKSLPEGKRLLRRNIAMLLLGMDRSLASLPSVASGIHGTESALTEEGANVLLADLPLVDRLPDVLSRKQVHGILAKGALQTELISNADQKLIQRLREIPTVWFLGRPQKADWGDVVESNDSEIGRLAAEYLLSRGHQRIAILDPKPNHVTLGQRCASFTWHATQGGATLENIFGKDADWGLPLKSVEDVELVDRLVGRLLKLKRQPTAVFVPADSIAALVYRACTRRGLLIGKDLSLISCNNEVPLLTGLYPEVTTIDICAEQIGRQAVEQLIWRMSHPETPAVNVSVQPCLVEGMSVTDLT
ncbi:LacI family DNA-binding transcriptional regulator [Gimesia aquarii]|uniref:Ribose operon repressor n=1 Tax=Gimesia aquarii TaxID=2527964 RepID=A0A517WX92_9PLAN|nr:LacI family DNA-binding transcriptional regulator [Gimesia aquarii]QDU09880.1 Ribose operon repressor [Gimesia aquarii]